jgi:hypothetical protein
MLKKEEGGGSGLKKIGGGTLINGDRIGVTVTW